MSLRIIYGRAGSGKSHFCIEDIKKGWEENPSRTRILMVPEQFTLQAERNLVKALGISGIGGPEVLSFRRLARRVLDEVGGSVRQYVNKAGKAMIIHNVLQDYRGELKAFGRAAGQKGFINELSGMFSEFKRYNIDPILLKDAIDKIEDRFLKDKLEDLSLVYSEYEEILHVRYIDTDDDLTFLAERIEKSKKLLGAEIWMDEFSGFTPQEYKVIEGLLKLSHRVNLSLCTDCLQDTTPILDIDVFAPTKYTGKKFMELAREQGIEIEKPVALNTEVPYRFRNSKALHHGEKNFFAYPHEKFKEKTESLNILAASNPYKEVENIAIEIIKLSRDRNLRYRDIAIITKDLDSYEKLVRMIFSQYDIPFFIDKKRSVQDHPLTLLVLSVIQIIKKNFSYESVFRYLKTMLLGIPREDIDLLENYVLSNGIKGSQWYGEKHWNYRLDFSIGDEEASEAEEELIKRINHIRQRVCKPIIQLKERLKASKVPKNYCRSLYEFLCEIKIPETIEELFEHYKEEGELDIAEQYRQIWNMILEVLDQIVEVHGEEKLSLDYFFDALAIGFSEYDMGQIFHALDQVLVGDVDRWRSHQIKALFILGVNDGVFLSSSRDEGMLTDKDRSILKDIGLELAADIKTQAFEEQFLLYNSLTKAENYLYISYPISDHEGKALRPSTVISRLKSIFPNMAKESRVLEGKKPIEDIVAPLPTFNRMISALRKLAPSDKELPRAYEHIYLWFLQQEEWGQKLEYARQGLFYTNKEKPLSQDKVKEMYGNIYYSSVSRLERYASCPFSYYVQYGLKAKERKVFKMGAMDIGSFLHEVISRFSQSMEEAGLDWRTVEDHWWEEQVELIIEEMIESTPSLPLRRTKRYHYLKERLARVIKRSIWLIIQHVRSSGFDPIGYEIAFGEKDGLPALKLQLPQGDEVVLTGRIDRVDLLESDKGNYIRIIDYKSGSKDFRLSDVYHGLQLQLITYLSALWEKGIKGVEGEVLPAGILYLKLDDPIIKLKGKEEDKDIDREIMKEMKMRGLILSDVDIAKQMDKNAKGYSDIVPVMIKGDGTLGKNSAVATLEQFEILREHAKDMLKGILGEMMKGDISISPYKQKKYTSCKFCPYSSICRFEGDMNSYRIIRDMKEEEVWNRLGKKEEKEGGKVLGEMD